MINAYLTDEKNNLAQINADALTADNIQGVWIDMVNPTDKEIECVSLLSAVPDELLKASLDDEERSRIEVKDDVTAVIFDIPVMEEEEGGYYSYYTIPMGFFITPQLTITVCLKETGITKDFMCGRIKDFYTYKKSRFLFQLMYNNSSKYLNYLLQIDKASQRIQMELRKNTRNKELIQLLDLDNSLVYFSTSLKGNEIVINRLMNSRLLKKYEEDNEILEDVGIENKQAIEMCTIYRDILSGTMQAYSSVISNNLNGAMKVLTILTVIMAIPTLIASFFGMNVKVPGEGSLFGFWAVTSASILISCICGILLFKKKKF